jgi:hypothetical protein
LGLPGRRLGTRWQWTMPPPIYSTRSCASTPRNDTTLHNRRDTLQVHATELWDLLDLLGLPPAWTPDAFFRFFSEVAREPVTNESLDWLSAPFRANEAHFGELSRADAERQTRLSGLKTRKVLQALRDPVSIPRRQLSPEKRRAAIATDRSARQRPSVWPGP